MKFLDRFSENASRRIAQRTSRRSFLTRLGMAFVGASTLPLLPVARASGADITSGVAPQSTGNPQDPGDPTQCDYWRYCAIDGFLCTFYEAIERAEELLIPPAITLDSVQLTDEVGETQGSGGASRSLIFLMVLPGISVWGLFLVGDLAMRDIVTEATQGTLRRQLSGPISAGQLILAKALFTAVLSSISLILLAAIGWGVARQAVDLAGFLVLSFALILAITGYAAVVYGGVGTERQGATISSVLLLIFAFLGGSFIQLNSLPSGMRRLAPISPFYWGTTGYQKLISDGGLSDVLPSVGVLAGLGVVLLSLGSVLLQRRLRRGTA